MDFFIKTATVIGFGETGASISSLLNAETKGITINIMDPSSEVEGGIIDLSHAAIPNGNTILWNKREHFNNSDLIFYTAGVRGEKGQNRRQKAHDNKAIIEQVFEGISLSKNALIVSISNPVEAICHWIHQKLGRSLTVLGTGTLLDTYRLKTIIASHFKRPTSAISTTVIGEHGTHMIPLWSKTSLDGKPLNEICSVDELQSMNEELLNAANRIRATQKATKYGVAQTAITLANYYFSTEERQAPFAHYSPEKDIYLNWVYKIGNRTIKPVNIEMTQVEQQRWSKALSALKSTIEH